MGESWHYSSWHIRATVRMMSWYFSGFTQFVHRRLADGIVHCAGSATYQIFLG